MNADPLSAPETLDRITRFRNGVRSFAEREKGLERALQLRESSRRQALEETRATAEKQHKADLVALRQHGGQAVLCVPVTASAMTHTTQ